MFWNPEVITTTGKSLRITQIQFNIIYIMRTSAQVSSFGKNLWPDARKTNHPGLM